MTTDERRTFTLPQTEIQRLVNLKIFPSELTKIWRPLNLFSCSPSTRTIAEYTGQEYQASITLSSSAGGSHLLLISATFYDNALNEPHSIVAVTFTETGRGYAQVEFDLSGIGFSTPMTDEQAQKALREISNILRMFSSGINFDDLYRELKTWCELQPLPPESLPPIIKARLNNERLPKPELG